MQKLKTFILKWPWVAEIIVPFWKWMSGPDKELVTYWVDRYLPNDGVLVQIGANDGRSGDPFYTLIEKNTQWRVLFVEPVRHLFDQLKRHYGQISRFKLENSGINEDGTSQSFYIVGKRAFDAIPNLSLDYQQIGSFSRGHVLALGGEKIEAFIEEIKVNCLTLQELFDKHEIDVLDALMIDAEGYDWKILKQLDINRYHPRIIYFEHIHLDRRETDEALKTLGDLYYLFQFGINSLCVRKEVLKPAELKYLQQKSAK